MAFELNCLNNFFLKASKDDGEESIRFVNEGPVVLSA